LAKIYFDDLEEFRVTVVKGANPGSKIGFKPGVRSIRIGRAVDNDVVISDAAVSRHHARIDTREEGCLIADDGSSTGVEKMGFKVGTTPEPISSGDEFKIGDSILRFEVIAKKGAQKRAAAREALEKAGGKTGPGPLERIGLGSRRAQLIVLAVLVVGAGYFLWPESKQLPPQSTGTLSLNYDAVIGYQPGDRRHLDKAVFEVPGKLDGLAIYFSVLGPSGVEIRVGNQTIATLPKDPKWQSYELLLVPKAFGQEATHQVTFDNLGFDPKQASSVDPDTVTPWGLAEMWMVRMPITGSSMAQLGDELASQRAIFERLQDSVSNRYLLLNGFRSTAVGLMKTSGRKFRLMPLPKITEASKENLGELIDAVRTDVQADKGAEALDKLAKAIQSLEEDLERDLRMQLNAATLAGKQGAAIEAGKALAIAAKTFPEPTDPRYRLIQNRVRRLSGGALDAYYAALEEMGRLR